MLNISIFCEISSSLYFLSLLQLKWVIHDASQVFRSYAAKYLLPLISHVYHCFSRGRQ